VIRRLATLGALVALAAACGEAEQSATPTSTSNKVLLSPTEPGRALAGTRRKARPAILQVTLVNGDTRRRVSGGRVRIAGNTAWSNRRGVARIRVADRHAYPVHVKARGFGARTVRESFRRRRKVTIRIYRPELQWPFYGATAARSQAQSHIRLRPPFRVVWSRGIGTLIEFPAVVSDGVAYIGNFRGTVRAISMRFGHVSWRTDLHAKLASSPAVVGDKLIVHTMTGYVHVLDRATGRRLWSRYIGSPIESSPVVLHGIDYFGAWNGRVYALDLRRRRLRWTYRSGYKITSSPALAGRTLFVGDYGGRLLALRARDGALRWARSVNGRIYGTPAVAGRRVFVPSSTGGSLTAFSTGGRRLWALRTGSYVYSSPAAWRGRVFFGAYNGSFYGVSASSGRILWRVRTGGSISGAAVVVDGIAYAGSFSHRIVGVDASTGRVRLRFPHGEYVPVSGNGGRLLLHGYSRIYAVEPRHRRRHKR
jgi:outer membrane protein assembly factor BamB